MMLHKSGDIVIPYKPRDVGEPPLWLPEMDSMQGKPYVVCDVDPIAGYVYLKHDDGDMYMFSNKWLDSYKELEDIEPDIKRFINEQI